MFTHKLPISTNPAKCGSSDSTDFSFPIVGTYPDLADVSHGGYGTDIHGYGIRPFGGTSTTVALKFRLVDYDPTTGYIEMWVKVPKLFYSVATLVYLFLGDAAINTDGSSGDVWDGHRMAHYHFKNIAGALDTSDSTSNGHDLTVFDAWGPAPGKVGSGTARSNGTGQFLQETAYGTITTPDSITVSFWQDVTTGDAQFDSAFNFGDRVDANQRLLTHAPYIDDNIYWDYGDANDPSGRVHTSYLGYYDAPTFVQLVHDHATGFHAIYLNGQLIVSHTVFVANPNLAGLILNMLTFSAYGKRKIDEFDISDTARGADWLLQEFNSQNDPSTFYSVGALVALPTHMTFALRDTEALVTDPSDEVFVGIEFYPTIRRDTVFGYDAISGGGTPTSVDRSNSNPTALAGIHYDQNTGSTAPSKSLTIDLMAFGGPGEYDIGLALGDWIGGQPEQYIQFFDDTTLLFTVTGATGVNQFLDANGTLLSAAAWVAGQTYRRTTFTSQYLRVRIGDPAGSGYTTLAALSVTVPSTGGGSNGTSVSTIIVGGSISASVAIQAASSSVVPLSGSSSVAVAVFGASSLALPLSGAATMNVLVQGLSSLALPLTGVATVGSGLQATSTRTLALTGSATITVAIQSTSVASLSMSGAIATTVAVQASSSMSIALSGAASLSVQVQVVSSVTLALTGTSNALVVVQTTSTVALALTGTIVVSDIQTSTATSTQTLPLLGSVTVTVRVMITSVSVLPMLGTLLGAVDVMANTTRTLSVVSTIAVSVSVVAQSTRSLGLTGTIHIITHQVHIVIGPTLRLIPDPGARSLKPDATSLRLISTLPSLSLLPD